MLRLVSAALRTLVGNDTVLAEAVLLPEVLVPKVLRALHDSPVYCHPDFKTTLLIVKHHAYWRGMARKVKQYCNNCDPCRRSKTKTMTHAGSHTSSFFWRVLERWGIDLVGPLLPCDGDKYILHVQCWASNFNMVATIPDSKAKTVAAGSTSSQMKHLPLCK